MNVTTNIEIRTFDDAERIRGAGVTEVEEGYIMEPPRDARQRFITHLVGI